MEITGKGTRNVVKTEDVGRLQHKYGEFLRL